jgi:hypothetical protein
VREMKTLVYAITLLALSGCNGTPNPPPPVQPVLPDARLIATPPVFATQPNEVEIADSMNAIDPTLVLGSLVNTKTGQVLNLDNYLAPGAKPTVTLQGEVVFRHLIENSVAANASYLDFVSAALSDSVRAEVSVVKASKATMKNDDLDRPRLAAELSKRPIDQRNDLGVVIGYLDFVLSATFFKEQTGEGNVSGYGAKIGGKWFNKEENSAAHHRVVAIWAPLPFIVEELARPVTIEGDLTEAAARALKTGELKQLRALSSLQLGEYANRIKGG